MMGDIRFMEALEALVKSYRDDGFAQMSVMYQQMEP